MKGFGVKIKKAIDTFAANTYTIPPHLQENNTDAVSAIGALEKQFEKLQTRYTIKNQMLADMIGDVRNALWNLKNVIDFMHKEPQETFESENIDGKMLAKLVVLNQGPNILESATKGLKSVSAMEKREGDAAFASSLGQSQRLATQLTRDITKMCRTIDRTMPKRPGLP